MEEGLWAELGNGDALEVIGPLDAEVGGIPSDTP